jgi:hypothetical protein
MEQKKKMKDMTAEELKAYNNERKRRSRAAKKAKKIAAEPIYCRDYEIPAEFQEQIAAYRKSILESITVELGDLSVQNVEVISLLSDVSFGFEHSIIQHVYDPTGLKVGGYYAEAAARHAVIHAHRTQILDSATFKKLYYTVLKEVVARAKKNADLWDENYVNDIRRELAGTFRLPVEPAPVVPEPQKPPAPVEPPPKVPSDKEIQEHGREQLFRQLDTNLSPDACRYLNGEPRR